MRRLSLAVLVLVLASFSFARDDKEETPPVYPRAGSDLPGPFMSYMVTGKRKTKFHCLITEHDLNPVVMVVARGIELTPERKYFFEKLDTAVHLNPNTRLAGFVVFLADKLKDPARQNELREELVKQVLDVQKDTNLKYLQLALSTKAQVEKYKIDDQAEVFVLFYNRYHTLNVYNLTREQLTQEKVKEILSAVTEQLGGRKPD